MVASNNRYTFFYPSFPRVFKNFDVICQAAEILEEQKVNNINIILTIDGTENKYSKYLLKKYSKLNNITFSGLLPKSKVEEFYGIVDCLIFPSKLETWGLPLSEFKPYFKPMLVADLPYAHESAAGASFVKFFNPDDPRELASYMEQLSAGKTDICKNVPTVDYAQPCSSSWADLFDILLKQ
jgi:glycosyltransferase involved in cell wall biosynthesis